STPAGNIGPVTEALMDALDCGFTISCPAFPENGRTVFKGYLFAGDVPLNESGMRHHPLTPMTDANLVRVLQAQTRRKVGHVSYEDLGRGPDAVRERFDRLGEAGVGIAIVDASCDEDLMRLRRAVADMPLVTAGSGVALGLPQNFEKAGLLLAPGKASELPEITGHRAIVSGSCSEATNAQVAHFVRGGGSACALDPLALAAGKPEGERALSWAKPLLPDAAGPIYSSATAQGRKGVQERPGAAHTGPP